MTNLNQTLCVYIYIDICIPQPHLKESYRNLVLRSSVSLEAVGCFLHLGDALAAEAVANAGFEVGRFRALTFWA